MKYQALLNGLEVSEVYFKNIDLGDRFDAEFFSKQSLQIENILKKVNAQELRNFGKFVASAFYPSAVELYQSGEMPFIRCVDCVNFPLITEYQESLFEKLPLYFIREQKGINTLHKGDIVITKVGTPCYTSLIQDYNEVALSRTVLGMQKISRINPYYLLIFLRSKYGFGQLLRHRELTIQYQLTLERTKKVLVYVPEKSFQDNIESIVKKYFLTQKIARELYSEAETLLLENLGLKNFQAINNPINIKSLKESFLNTGRLDAEFYQPFYEQLEQYIQSHSLGFARLGNVCKLHDENYTPKDNQEYNYIELSNIGKSGEITGCTRALGKELPSRARRKVRSNQVIISSIEGSLQSCAIVSSNYDDTLCSTGFYVLSSEILNAETLLVLFKSELMQQILKKNCSGTILTAINKEELLNIPLPIIDTKTQTKISDYIQQSNALRQQAQDLLAQAKIKVESEIENNALNINELDLRGGGVDPAKFHYLLDRSRYFTRMAEWTLLESILFCQSAISLRSFSQSFGASGRLDAEYYQPKFERLFAQLERFKSVRLGDIVDLQKSIEPGSDAYQSEGIPFVRVSDLSKLGISQTDKYLNPNDFSNVIRPKKDTILLTKDGTVGIAYCVPQDLDVITSGAIVH